MILKVIILVVFALPMHSINAAETPLQPTQESEIPLSLNADHNKEIKKFQKYDLDHPEKFLELLHKKLKKDKNLFQYLKNLRLFATRLLVQAILAQAAADHFYLASYSQKLKDSFNAINDEIESYEAKPDIFIFTTQNDEQFEQMLLYSEIVSEKKLYSPEQMQTIYRWIIDPSKGKHLNLFGQTKKLAQEIKLVNQLNTQNRNKFYILQDALYATDYDRDYYDDADIIRENEVYLFQLFFDFERANKKISQAREKGIKARKLALIFQEYADEQMPLLNIYAHIYPYYQKLYAIIYNELIATRNELIRKDPKRIKELSAMTNSFPEMKEEAVPKKLPQEIAAFIPPSQTFTLPSLDNELAKARIEWQADQKIKAQQEEIKKQEAQAKEATKKIKESPLDGSYIRANDETQGSITIHNPKNNTTEVIFKTDKPNQIKKLPPIKYTNWVKMWFENPQEALEKQGYTKLAILNMIRQKIAGCR